VQIVYTVCSVKHFNMHIENKQIVYTYVCEQADENTNRPVPSSEREPEERQKATVIQRLESGREPREGLDTTTD
jgi:hypothetical protein